MLPKHFSILGKCRWRKTNRKSKNAICAIGLKEGKESFLSISDLYCIKDFSAYEEGRITYKKDCLFPRLSFIRASFLSLKMQYNRGNDFAEGGCYGVFG
jgi:hypothetical protein